MKELIQRSIKAADRKELDQLYEYVKSGELLNFIQGEIIFRNDVSLKEQDVNIGDCFYRKNADGDYYIARVDMIKENPYTADVTQIYLQKEDLDVWDTEIRVLELMRVWKPFDKTKTQEIINLWESADRQTAVIWDETFANALKIVSDENNQHS
jgi:hypothetical protein